MKTDRQLLNIARRKLREARKQLVWKQEEDELRVQTIIKLFKRLQELGEYQDSFLLNGAIITIVSSNK